MLKEISFEGLGIAPRNFFTVFLLLFNSFSWHYVTLFLIDKILRAFNVADVEALVIWIIYYAAIIGSSIAGSLFSRMRKLHFLYLWIALGTVSSLLPILPGLTAYVWSFMLGFSFGLGIPSCLAYFSDHLIIENRGRISGIISLATYLSVPFLVVAFGWLDLEVGFMFLAIWRGAGLILFFLQKPKEMATTKKQRPVFFDKILRDKPFVLYLVPWLMFILIDRFERPVLWSFYELYFLELAVVVEPIIGSVSAFFGGFLSDRIGRKRVVISGFVALGLAYAVIGINPTLLIFWYFYIIVDGVAWGILMAMFILTLWGDLSQPGTREKYYVIGNIPLYLTSILQLLLTLYIKDIPSYAAFSLASFFLFLAVLPLMYAPETLPQKKIELRRLRRYVEAAKKVREKHSKKGDTAS